MNEKHLLWIIPMILLIGTFIGSNYLVNYMYDCSKYEVNISKECEQKIYDYMDKFDSCASSLRECSNKKYNYSYNEELLVENIKYRNILQWHFNYSINQPYLYENCSSDNSKEGINRAIDCVNKIEGKIVLTKVE